MDEQFNLPQAPLSDSPGAPLEPTPLGPTEPHSSIMKKVLIFGGLVVALLLGVFLWWLFAASGQSLAISIAAPDRVQTGVPVEIAVNMNNDSGTDLKDAQVSLSLPENFIFVGVPGKRSVENKMIGTLAERKLTKATFLVMATGGENSIAEIRAAVSYVPGALSSRFEKRMSASVVVGEQGLELSVAPPTKAFGGEEFTTEIHYKNVSAVDFYGVTLKMLYPPGFSFKSATQAPRDMTNTAWELGSLPAGGEGQFSIKGYILGQDNENFNLEALISAAIGEASYDIARQTGTVNLAPAPLSIRIEPTIGRDAVFGAGQTIRYKAQYTNNTSIALRDVIIQAKLIGEMIDLRKVDSLGVLRASDATIVWNASRVPELANLPPGFSGSIDFGITLKPDFPITRLSSKNYSVSVKSQIESPTVPANVASNKTIGISEVSNKIRGNLIGAAGGYYRDIASGIANKGNLPPRVGQMTQFTIHWSLRNTSTDVEDVVLRAFLGPNVAYTGVSKTTVASTTLEYNDRTQEVVWRIPKIAATRGVLSDPPQMIFQVALTPAQNQLGNYADLIGETALSYKDSFTQEVREARLKTVTTRVPEDLTVANMDRVVRE